MKRLCVYVIYDAQMVINQYVECVLAELKKFATDRIVVCNFEKVKRGMEFVIPYTSKIICRKNLGYDAGAYKEVLLGFLTRKELLEYDELLLTNDSYFAPIYPFDKMFTTMEYACCDFWGITKHPKAHYELIGDFDEHIQSYFICFKKVILHNNSFIKFWEELECTESKEKTILNFEIGISNYLREKGFVGLSYLETLVSLSIFENNANPYNKYGYDLIRDYGIPILKKTNFYGDNQWLRNAYLALYYIEDYTNYNACLITDYLYFYQKRGLLGAYYDFEAMERFVRSHERIFIYGAGVWGHIASDYFDRRGWVYESYVLTRGDGANPSFSTIMIQKTDGFIIAQSIEKTCYEIVDDVGKKCAADQLFLPCFPKK